MSSELEKRFEKYIIKHVRNSSRTYELGVPLTAPIRKKKFKMKQDVQLRIMHKLLRIKRKEEEKHSGRAKVPLAHKSNYSKFCNNVNCLTEIEAWKGRAKDLGALLEKRDSEIAILKLERE